MKNNAPNKVIAPAIITGVTLAFLATAYAFVFAKPKGKVDLPRNVEQPQSNQKLEPSDSDHPQ